MGGGGVGGADGDALGQAVAKIQQIERDLKTPITLDGSFQGTAQAFQSSLKSTPLLVAAAKAHCRTSPRCEGCPLRPDLRGRRPAPDHPARRAATTSGSRRA